MGNTQDSFLEEKGMERENFNGIMERYSKESGGMEKRTALECGNLPKGTFMKDSGKIIDSMAKDIMFTKAALSIEAILNNF